MVPKLKFRYVVQAQQGFYSPDGPVRVVPTLTGLLKLGLPSELKLTFCTEV